MTSESLGFRKLVFLTAAAFVHCTGGPHDSSPCERACGVGQICTPAGRCELGSVGVTGSNSTPGAAGSLGKIDLAPMTANAGSEGVDRGLVENCVDAVLEVSNTIPTVVLLIDRSASMSAEQFDPNKPGVSRWDALKAALLDPNGAIGRLQDQVRFGVVFYAGGGGKTCPYLDKGGEPATLMPPRKGLLAPLTAYFQPLDTKPDTPTGESVALTAAELAAFTEVGPKFIVLATDGEPDLCANREEPSGRARSLAEVTKAYEGHISTFVISVGTDVAETHLAEIANAGQGFPPSDVPPTPRFYQVTTQQALADAFQKIIDGARSCTFTLNGEIDPSLADRGKVFVDGMPIPLSDTDGWRVVNGTTIELVGSACAALQSGKHDLSASFPCEVIVKPPH